MHCRDIIAFPWLVAVFVQSLPLCNGSVMPAGRALLPQLGHLHPADVDAHLVRAFHSVASMYIIGCCGSQPVYAVHAEVLIVAHYLPSLHSFLLGQDLLLMFPPSVHAATTRCCTST